MKIKKPKAYFIDVDGTLTKGHNDQEISFFNLRSINAALRDGSYIILSSGRSPYAMMEVWKKINNNRKETSYIIANNGAVILDARLNKIEFSKSMDEYLFKKIGKYLWDKGYCFKNAGKSEYFFKHKNLKSKLFSKIISLNSNFDDWKFNEVNARKIGVIISFSRWHVKKIADDIQKKFPKCQVTISGPGLYIEINPIGVSKGEAINFLCKKLDINPLEVVHIGDSMNDASGFEIAGIGIAMKNGMRELKRKADYITDTVKKNGVSKAIDSLRKNDTYEKKNIFF